MVLKKKATAKKNVKKIPWPGVTKRRHHIFMLPVDSIWIWRSCIYLELKDIFGANEQGFNGESRNSKHSSFNAFEEYVALGISTKL